jgi:hypothetical protein
MALMTGPPPANSTPSQLRCPLPAVSTTSATPTRPTPSPTHTLTAKFCDPRQATQAVTRSGVAPRNMATKSALVRANAPVKAAWLTAIPVAAAAEMSHHSLRLGQRIGP